MEFYDSIALVGAGQVGIQFSKESRKADAKAKDIVQVTPEMANKQNVAYWGGDNLYPQNVMDALETAGTARSILDFKAKALYGGGIVYGKHTGVDDKGYPIFTPAAPDDKAFEPVRELFRNNNNFYRFYLEFNQDWTHFGNCFPRLRLNVGGDKVVQLIHEESSDCRYEQMNDDGKIPNVFLSKFWAPIEKQFVKASKNDKLKDRAKANHNLNNLDRSEFGKLVKVVPCIDMYNALESMKELVSKGERNLILPVNYPSPGKTYYQSPVWDAVRLAGWLDIASQIPKMMQSLYSKAFKINYHIEVSENYFRDTVENWDNLKVEEKKAEKQKFASTLDKFLAGSDNAYTSLLTFFKFDRASGKEIPGVKITPIKNNIDIDKDMLLTSVINQEISFALQMNPAIIGAGAPGKQSAGSGSDIREAWLVFLAMLHLERQIILEPVRLAAIFNGAPEDIVFKFLDVKLTTLDNNSGTEKTLS